MPLDFVELLIPKKVKHDPKVRRKVTLKPTQTLHVRHWQTYANIPNRSHGCYEGGTIKATKARLRDQDVVLCPQNDQLQGALIAILRTFPVSRWPLSGVIMIIGNGRVSKLEISSH